MPLTNLTIVPPSTRTISQSQNLAAFPPEAVGGQVETAYPGSHSVGLSRQSVGRQSPVSYLAECTG